jgi:hypothetical protein
MRYINKKHLQRLANLRQLNAAHEAMCQIHNEDERTAFIDAHMSEWGDLRYALWTLGCGKCWYSEAVLQYQQGHVEHFRPKKKVATEKHCGYWWDAFDAGNLRFAHPTTNIRVTDYLTGQKAGKGTYFPLKNPSARATDKVTEQYEEPVLLDPTVAGDCRLLCFDTSSGTPIASFSESEDAWKHKRAVASIDYYHLDEGTWNYQRKDLIDEVATLCDEIIAVASAPFVDQNKYDALLSDLLVYLEPFSEFTAVAMQVIREKGLIEKLFPVPGID